MSPKCSDFRNDLNFLQMLLSCAQGLHQDITREKENIAGWSKA